MSMGSCCSAAIFSCSWGQPVLHFREPRLLPSKLGRLNHIFPTPPILWVSYTLTCACVWRGEPPPPNDMLRSATPTDAVVLELGPTSKREEGRNEAQEESIMDSAKRLIVCFLGIFLSYLVYALVQEKMWVWRSSSGSCGSLLHHYVLIILRSTYRVDTHVSYHLLLKWSCIVAGQPYTDVLTEDCMSWMVLVCVSSQIKVQIWWWTI